LRKLRRQSMAEVSQRHIAKINTRQLPAAKWRQRTDLPRTRQRHSVLRMGPEQRPMVCQSYIGPVTKDRCEICKSPRAPRACAYSHSPIDHAQSYHCARVFHSRSNSNCAVRLSTYLSKDWTTHAEYLTFDAQAFLFRGLKRGYEVCPRAHLFAPREHVTVSTNALVWQPHALI
jgi:hypothetical protein